MQFVSFVCNLLLHDLHTLDQSTEGNGNISFRAFSIVGPFGNIQTGKF